MKVGKSKGAATSGGVARGGRKTESSGVDFRHLFQAQLSTIAGPEPTAAAATVEDRPAVPPQLRMEGLRLTEATIDSLDAFAKALARTEISAEELEPFVAALEEEGQGLVNISDQLPKDDPLAQLIEQVAATCFLETGKFRRGDYS